MAAENKKRVKVQSKYRPSQSRCMGATGKNVPWLTVSGVWLGEFGFKAGDTVSITSYEKLLVIRLLEEDFQQDGNPKTQ